MFPEKQLSQQLTEAGFPNIFFLSLFFVLVRGEGEEKYFTSSLDPSFFVFL
jgi:hypothetical protein